jgi:hypothetical protein
VAEHLGVPEAVDASGRRWRRAAIEQRPQPFVKPLHCAGCSTPVVPVHGYVTRFSTEVQALYRLTDRDASPHEQGCLYDFDAQVGRLATQNRPLVRREDEVYELQLPHPLVTVEAERRPRPARGARSRLQVGRPPGVALDPVIKAAAAIVRLLHRFGQDPAAAANFRARYGERLFTWTEFCFDAGHDVKRLVQKIGADPDRPYAVVGTVKDAGVAAAGSSYLLQLDTRIPVRTADGDRVQVFVRAREQSRLNGAVGDTVACYGRWSLFTPPRGGVWVTLWTDELGAVATV